MISGVEVRVGGAPLDATLAERSSRCASTTTRSCPTRSPIRISDPGARARRHRARSSSAPRSRSSSPRPTAATLTSLIVGPDRRARARVHASATSCSPRAATTTRHALHRSSTSRDLPEHDGRRTSRRRSPQRAGFQVGEIADGGGVARLRAAEQRDRLGLPLAARTARRLRGRRREETLHFRKAASQRRSSVALQLGRGPARRSARASPACSRSTRSIVRSWDPKHASRPSTSVAKGEDATRARSASSAPSVRKALGGGTLTVSDRPVSTARGGRRARREPARRSSATPTSRPRARRAATRGCAPG